MILAICIYILAVFAIARNTQALFARLLYQKAFETWVSEQSKEKPKPNEEDFNVFCLSGYYVWTSFLIALVWPIAALFFLMTEIAFALRFAYNKILSLFVKKSSNTLDD